LNCKHKIELIEATPGKILASATRKRTNQPLLVSLINQLLVVAADVDNDRLYGFAFANFANEKGHFELPTYIALKRVLH
jgi:hypothetical protein